MITRRSLFGLTFGATVAGATAVIDKPGQQPPIMGAKPAPPPMRLTIGQHGHACKVEIGGVDVSHMCSGAFISARANDVTTLHLEMVVLKDSEIMVEPGTVDVSIRNLPGRLRFEADNVRVKADV